MRLRSIAARLTVVAFVLAGCAQSKPPGPAPLDLGTWSRHVTTSSKDAQAAFDRGLVLNYSFNHGAAERAFREAVALDSTCAMAWWGVALANGPHINNPAMSLEQVQAASQAMARANALVAGASPVERQLVEALGRRYTDDPEAPRGPLDQAYADAMKALWNEHPEDADIGALCAEALMDLHPWDLWTPKGDPRPWTNEVLGVLEAVLAKSPDQPLANHLYVHAVEGGPLAEKGVPSADRLRTLVPDAGHMVHMPGHIYVRVGRWADASQANLDAIAADARWRAHDTQEPGFYRLYMAHDHQFLAFSEMMRGRSTVALQAARDMVDGIPDEFLSGPAGAVADGFLPIVGATLVRFGRWEDMLKEPEVKGGLPVSKALYRFQRATALTALDRLDEAEVERTAFRAAAHAVPADAIVGNNTAAAIMAVATNVLDGEMAARRKHWDEAIRTLREAAALEDQLLYDDPPDWMQPVRHSLGAVLLNAGKPAEAEVVYREDLVRYPENGWSLYGLERALRMQDKATDAEAVAARFEKAWADASTQIGASCLCQMPR